MNAPNDLHANSSATAVSPSHVTAGSNGNGHGGHAHGGEQAIPADLRQPRTAVVIVVVLAFVALLVAMFFVGWVPHHSQAVQAHQDAEQIAAQLPRVSVTAPRLPQAAKDIVLPADVRPNQETQIFARANGYMKTLLHDIHDRVKAGELLAEIDTPEVDAQLVQNRAALEQAKANVIKAEADLDLAQRTLNRYTQAEKESSGSVIQQQIDAAKNAYDDAVAEVAQAKANVDVAAAAVVQYEALQSFEKVTAPFTGTITERQYDVGALVGPANSTSVAMELFRISQTDPLRVFVDLPQTYATNIRIGQPAYLMVRNYPGREFVGIVARTSSQLNSNTRTLLVETHFPNKDGTLYPGMYGQVRLLINQENPPLVIPSSALVFNAGGMQVGLVRNGILHFQPITLGRDLGNEVEVAFGLSTNDEVVTNPGLQLSEGGKVEVVMPDGKMAMNGKAGPDGAHS